jgi:HD superfamily phosphohydrolase
MAGVDTGFGPDIGRPVDNILKYLYYDNGKIYVDAKAVNSAMDVIQHTYNYFYKDLFLCKSAQIVQRFMQKVIYRLLSSGGLTEELLWDMTDIELMAEIIKSEDPVIQHSYWEVYRRGMDYFPKTGLTIKLGGRLFNEREKEETGFIEAEYAFFRKFAELCDPASLELLENEIGNFLSIPGSGVVVPSLTEQSLRRFRPEDVNIYNSAVGITTLRQYKSSHFEALEDSLFDFMAVRVCVPPDFRRRLYDKAGEVYDLIEEMIGAR